MELRDKYRKYVARVEKRHRYDRGNSYMRDSDLTKTYRGEWALWNEFTFETMSNEDAEKFVERVHKSKFWGSLRPVTIEWMKDMGDHGRTTGVSYGQLIKLAPRTNKYVILHEMVHSMGYMNHGLYFRLQLVKACSRFLGRDVAKRLKELFREQGLRMNKPRPPLSYDKWVEKYEQYVN